MAFGSMDSNSRDQPLTEINMIPMIDIMLVLLIIFIVTAPLLTHAVKIDLPQVNSAPNVEKADAVQVAIDDAQTVFWNGTVVTEDNLESLMKAAGKQPTPPEIHLSIAKRAPYESVAKVMSMAAQAGLGKIAFITEPIATP